MPVSADRIESSKPKEETGFSVSSLHQSSSGLEPSTACLHVEPACRQTDATRDLLGSRHAAGSTADAPRSHSPPKQPSATPIKCRLLYLSLPARLSSVLLPSQQYSAPQRQSESCSVADWPAGRPWAGLPPLRRGGVTTSAAPSTSSFSCSGPYALSCQFLWFYFMYSTWMDFFFQFGCSDGSG
jgi:hypothetical protein